VKGATIRNKEASMKAKELMTRTVECIAPETPLGDAAKKMKSLDVGFLPVCEDDRLVGTITDRDIVLRAIAEGKDARTCKAREVMSEDVLWCYEDQTGEEVAEYMANEEIRRVLILNKDKRLVGVISIGDLAKGGEQQNAGEAIKDIASAPPAQAA
jgi:CBS domain-containing protein